MDVPGKPTAFGSGGTGAELAGGPGAACWRSLQGLRGEIDAQSSTKLTGKTAAGWEQRLVLGDREMAEHRSPAFRTPACRRARRNIQACLRQTRQDIRLTDPGRWLRPAGRGGLARNRRRFLAVRRRGRRSAAGIAASWAGSSPAAPHTAGRSGRADTAAAHPAVPHRNDGRVPAQPSHPDANSTTALQHQLRRELYLLTRRHAQGIDCRFQLSGRRLLDKAVEEDLAMC